MEMLLSWTTWSENLLIHSAINLLASISYILRKTEWALMFTKFTACCPEILQFVMAIYIYPLVAYLLVRWKSSASFYWFCLIIYSMVTFYLYITSSSPFQSTIQNTKV